MIIIALVVLAAVLHASWNAIVKSIDDRLSVMAVLGLTTTVVCLPIALLAPSPRDALPFLIGSVAVHGAYTLLLVVLYADSDFNQAYPLARGISPPAVALFAVLVVGERLSAWQVIGLAVLSAGLLGVALRGGRSRRALGLAVLTGCAIAAYTVLDGLGVRRAGSTFGYAGWLFVAQGMIVALVWLRRRAPRVWRERGAAGMRSPAGLVPRAIVAGAVSVLAYGLVLWAQAHGQLAIVAALRETSVVFGAVIGATVFNETMPSRRIAASAMIAAGAVALAIA